MSTVGVSRANQNRAIRQEALRASLEAGGHIQHVLVICKELDDLSIEMDATAVQRKRAVIDTNSKWVVEFVNADPQDK